MSSVSDGQRDARITCFTQETELNTNTQHRVALHVSTNPPHPLNKCTCYPLIARNMNYIAKQCCKSSHMAFLYLWMHSRKWWEVLRMHFYRGHKTHLNLEERGDLTTPWLPKHRWVQPTVLLRNAKNSELQWTKTSSVTKHMNERATWDNVSSGTRLFSAVLQPKHQPFKVLMKAMIYWWDPRMSEQAVCCAAAASLQGQPTQERA